MSASHPRRRVGGTVVAYLLAVTLFLLTRAAPAAINVFVLVVVAATVLAVTRTVSVDLAAPSRRRDRWTVIGALAIFGAVLVAWWQLANPPDGVGFAGIASLYLAFGLVVGEGRRSDRNGVVGLVVLVGCGLAVGAGLVGLDAAGATWWTGGLVGLGILATPIGLNLASAWATGESHADAEPPEPPRWWLIVGAIAFGGVVVAALALGMPAGWLLLLAGALVVLMVAIAMRSSLDIVIVVVALAAVLLTSQEEVATPAAVARADGQPAFAALGDSFISGEGARDFLAGTNVSGSNQCRRSPRAYAPLLAEDPPKGVPDHVVFLACSGAKTIEIAGTNQYPVEPTYHVDVPTGRRAVLGQLGVLDALRKHIPIRFVLLSIGGNDALFGNVAQTCLLPGDCWKVGQAWLDHLEVVERRLEHTYGLIADHLKHVPVLVMPYPIPLADHACDYSLFTPDETKFLYGFTQALNGVVQRAAAHAGFQYVDTVPAALENRRICDGPRGDIAVNFLRFNGVTGPFEDRINPKNWLHNNLHPNEDGHALIRDALVRWLHDHPLDALTRQPRTVSGHVPTLAEILPGHTATVCADSRHVEDCSTDWSLGETVHAAVTRGGLVVLAAGGAWLLALFGVVTVRRRRDGP